MRITDKSLAASPSIYPQQQVQEWAQGVYELFKTHQVELISYVPDGGHKQLIALCQRDPALRTVVLTTEEEREEWTIRYQGLMAHYGCDPTTNNAGIAHGNGDAEQSHFRFKDALDQALRVRGSRDFADRQAYERFVQDLVRIGNEQ